jgi:hypothetical protein
MQCANVFNNLAFAWEGLKFGIGKDKYVAKNVIEVAMVFSKGHNIKATFSNYVGLHKKTINFFVKWKQLFTTCVGGENWAKGD